MSMEVLLLSDIPWVLQVLNAYMPTSLAMLLTPFSFVEIERIFSLLSCPMLKVPDV